MRILHIYKDYFPILGGIENHVRLLAESQAARGDDVAVLVASRDRRTHVESLNGVRVLFAARLATLSSAPLSLAMLALLRAEQPDVVHLHFPYPWGETANLVFGRAPRTIVTYHSDIVRQKISRLFYAPLLSRVLARADRILVNNPNVIATSAVLTRWREKVLIVPMGIDPAPFLPSRVEKAAALRRRLLGSEASSDVPPAGPGLLLFVGRLRYYKGLGTLLTALASLPTAQLAVVGTGPMESEWRALAGALGLAPRVHFLGDVSEAELPAYYQACDLFVLPASERSEGYGLVQLEAMASARAVVSCDVGTGVAWVNQNERTGLVVPPRDPPSLAAAIERLFADPALRARFGAAGRARVLGELNAAIMVARVDAVYRGRDPSAIQP